MSEATQKTILIGGGHVKLNPMIHEAEGGHYGWQMSSIDHDILQKALAENEELKFLHDPEEPVEFGHDGVELTHGGLPVSVHAS